MHNNDLKKIKENYADFIQQTPTFVWVFITTIILTFIIYNL